MRAPLCPDSAEINPEDQGLIVPGNECNTEIQSIQKSLERKHSNKTAAFGICLDNLMGTSPRLAPQVPFVLSRLCRYIEAHGLRRRRLFLENDDKNVVETLKVEFIESGDAPLEAAGNVTSVAKLLVIFFEELPEPLIPVMFHSSFAKDMEKLCPKSSECISHLKYNISKLPDTISLILKYLSRFLLQISSHHKYNGMNTDNLAFLFGPLIFRPAVDDETMLSYTKTIVTCFVSDYHAIFESGALSDIVIKPTDISLKQRVELTDSRQQHPCPSSIMPLMSLSPLSVIIPSVEVADENNGNVPILIIESQINHLTETHRDEHPVEDSVSQTGNAPTRKRKERRPSGEEVQVQRSSSEERPQATSLEKEFMRRCSSHEEMNSEESPAGVPFIKKNVVQGTYSTESLELVLNDGSPHPPNAKRREVELKILEKAKEKPLVENMMHSRRNVIESIMDKDNPSVETAENNLNLNVTSQYGLQQNSLTELDIDNIMDFSGAKESVVEEEEQVPDVRSNVPRSASCPVPSSDSENNSQSDECLSLSWSMLFESEDAEPIRSEHRMGSKEGQEDALLSPSVQSLRQTKFYEAPLSPSAYRNYLSYRTTHLDSSVPPSPPVEQEDFAKSLVEGSTTSDSIKQLTKRIHSLKKRIRKFDENFEADFGYKPSHAEKSTHPEAKKLMSDLHKARKELKALKEESHLEAASSGPSWKPRERHPILGDTTNNVLNAHYDKLRPSVEQSVGETLKGLADDRSYNKRPEIVEDMTQEQVQDEKLAIQKALLHFESIHGKPSEQDDRNRIRPLYERYRSIKRLIFRSSSYPGASSKSKDSCTELQPILEHETMDFTSPQHRTTAELPPFEIKEEEDGVSNIEVPCEDFKTAEPCSKFLNSKYDNSNFHELPLSELIFQLQKAKSEKRHLRKILREFEMEFQRINARKVQKEDKAPIEALYGEYKHVKARLKLLEALISKHDQHQLM